MPVKFPVKYPIRNLNSVESRQKIGKPNLYGRTIYGWSVYGDSNVASGIYRIHHYHGKKYKVKMAFYPYVIKYSVAQNAQRLKYKNAYLAWRALAPAEKIVYNLRATGRHYFGYHLFMKENLKA